MLAEGQCVGGKPAWQTPDAGYRIEISCQARHTLILCISVGQSALVALTPAGQTVNV